jgi:hypothetical protein
MVAMNKITLPALALAISSFGPAWLQRPAGDEPFGLPDGGLLLSRVRVGFNDLRR